MVYPLPADEYLVTGPDSLNQAERIGFPADIWDGRFSTQPTLWTAGGVGNVDLR